MRTRSSQASGHPPRAVAELDEKALVENFQAIRDLAGGQSIMPMVKADAYGHGAGWVARALAREPGLDGFGVATLEEGAALRAELGLRNRRARIVVFSGAAAWDDGAGGQCEEHGLTPVIVSEGDWVAFRRGGWTARLPYEVKFNTGMNRLGLPASFAGRLARELAALAPDERPRGILSHLAVGEDPAHPVSRQQRERFLAIRSELASAAPGAHFHLANSAALWCAKGWGLDGLTDVVRPGIALYGIRPWPAAPARGVRPVLRLRARVVQVRALKPGDAVGYGGWKLSEREGAPSREARVQKWMAVLGAGYADCIPRSLSAQAKVPARVLLGGKLRGFLGPVSMDLAAIECSQETRVGEWAELWGPEVDPWEQALAAGTIPYELLTSLSGRVKRIHAGEPLDSGSIDSPGRPAQDFPRGPGPRFAGNRPRVPHR